jgi:hypothetical protein
MDALDRIAESGRDLLARVDAVLVTVGGPDEPELWSLLGRLGALPGDALDFVATLRPEPLRALAGDLGRQAQAYVVESDALAALTVATAWEGSGAEAFTAQWRSLLAHLGTAAEADGSTMTGRALATASYVDALAGWVADSRMAMASTLATVLTSAEAVVLRSASAAGATETPPLATHAAAEAPAPDVIRAAVRVSVRVLRAVDDVVRAGHDLYGRWTPSLDALAYRPPGEIDHLAPGAAVRVHH